MINYLIAFSSGLFVKLVDLTEEHGLKMNKLYKIFFSLFYGFLCAYLITIAPFPGFWFGLMTGLLLAGKIDAFGHYIAFSTILVSLSFLGFPLMNPFIVLLSVIVNFVEEKVNDNIVDKKKVKGVFLKFLELRPILEITALTLSIMSNNFELFFLLFFFDLGYFVIKKLTRARCQA